MKRHSHNLGLKLFMILLGCSALFGFQSIHDQTIQLTAEDFTGLQTKKEKILDGDRDALEFFNDLIKEADEAMNSGPYSVVHKTGVPPSGDKHDYMSLAPYWWPNPDTPDGLPYIRKDGEINPEARNNFSDYTEKANFFNAVEVLGKAYYYSEDKKYAEKAKMLLSTWFIDDATIMNPHLDFGQGIRGINDGRCFGVIEFGGLRNIITTLELLKIGGDLDAAIENGMKEWLGAYIDWLQNSELGAMEGTRSNNHGTTYDVQLCSILLYLGKMDEVKNRLETITKPRIVSQIEPDGSQPLELARTKAFSYSVMNLEAFTRLAWYGKRLDLDLWNFETEDGRSLKKAHEFLIPYVATDKEWEYQQITQMASSQDRLARLLINAGNEFDEPSYIKLGEDYFKMKK